MSGRNRIGAKRIGAAFRKDRRGSALVQFAMVAAPFVALLIGTVETALVYFTQQALETAAEAAARRILTGEAQTSATGKDAFKQQVCDDLPSYLKCANVYVDVRKASTFADIDTAKPTITYNGTGAVSNSFAYDLGGAGEIVILRLMYLWPVSTGPLGFDLSNSGANKRLLVATSVAKTETYG